MEVSLEGTVTLVTGGGRGLGAAVARRFAAEGSDVVVLDLGVEEEVPGTEWIRTDVTSEEQVAAAVEQAREGRGRIDNLVCCAGVIGPVATVQQTDPGEWRRTIEINLTGTFMCCRAVLPGMLEQGRGQIVNFASAAAVEHSAGQAAYNSSKAAVISLTKTLAREVHGSGVRVNAICPGPVDTPLIGEFLDQDSSEMPERVRRNHVAHQEMKDEGIVWEPDQVIDLIVFLASPAGSHLNGQFLRMSNKAEPGVYH